MLHAVPIVQRTSWSHSFGLTRVRVSLGFFLLFCFFAFLPFAFCFLLFESRVHFWAYDSSVWILCTSLPMYMLPAAGKQKGCRLYLGEVPSFIRMRTDEVALWQTYVADFSQCYICSYKTDVLFCDTCHSSLCQTCAKVMDLVMTVQGFECTKCMFKETEVGVPPKAWRDFKTISRSLNIN